MDAQRGDAANHILQVALRLFAERGIDGVTVREIAQAAGQKNHAAVTYHFGSKSNLVRAIILEGAQAIDAKRNAWLDKAEKENRLQSVFDVVKGLMYTSLIDTPGCWSACFNRFVLMISLSNREFFHEVLEDKWNSGYQRCLAHIRKLCPDISPKDINRRLLFMGTALSGLLSTREADLANQSHPHQTWADDSTLVEAAKSIAAMITRP